MCVETGQSCQWGSSPDSSGRRRLATQRPTRVSGCCRDHTALRGVSTWKTVQGGDRPKGIGESPVIKSPQRSTHSVGTEVTISYRPGSRNGNADGLSRQAWEVCQGQM